MPAIGIREDSDVMSRSPFKQNRLLVVQPYVPTYREPLFALMKSMLAERGVHLAVASARAAGSDVFRNDDVTQTASDFILDERRLEVGSKTLLIRGIGQAVDSFRPQFIVVEQAIKNLESWPLLLRRGGPSVALWGQGRSYSTSQSPLEERVKQWMTRRADWFFAYTQAGAEHVIANGFPASRTTVLHNATDAAALQANLDAIRSEDLKQFRDEHGLTEGLTGLFLGGVDERKGIPFLLAVVDRLAASLPGFRMLVGGTGTLADEVRRRQVAGAPLVSLGRIDGSTKALALASSDVLMIPEWVGLVAVDALASGTPIVTTVHPSHSPEAEYLVDGVTAMFAPHDIDAYAQAVSALLLDRDRLKRMSDAGLAAGANLTIEAMASRYVDGIMSWRDDVLRPM